MANPDHWTEDTLTRGRREYLRATLDRREELLVAGWTVAGVTSFANGLGAVLMVRDLPKEGNVKTLTQPGEGLELEAPEPTKEEIDEVVRRLAAVAVAETRRVHGLTPSDAAIDATAALLLKRASLALQGR